MTAIGPASADLMMAMGAVPGGTPAQIFLNTLALWHRFGSEQALRWCAVALVEGRGVDRVPAEGVGVLVALVDRGDTASMVALGELHQAGAITGRPDLDAALAWYRKAAVAGDALGMFPLVEICSRSPKPEDRAEAFGWALRLMSEDARSAEYMRERLADVIADLTVGEIEAAAATGRRSLH